MRKTLSIICIAFVCTLGIAWLFVSLRADGPSPREYEPTVPASLGISYQTKAVRIKDVSITAEIADTEEKMTRGLSGRERISEGRGMLFMFPFSDRHGIWMKDMNFAIDIVWIGDSRRVTSVEHAVAPETFPKVFYPSEQSLYVLELPAGFAADHGITVGDAVEF